MFTPRGYAAVPQDVASQDEEEVFENNNLTRSFEHRNNLSTSATKNQDAMSTPHTSRESEEGETKERRIKRNVRFESRSMDADKPEPMSNARRLCFVVSLMICTLTIFVFAFTVPCKGPSCNVANMITTVTSNLEKFHRNWSMHFSGYSTGIVFHLSSTKTREVVVSYDGRKLEEDQTRNEKFGRKWNGKSVMQNQWNTKKSGLISLNEDNGKLEWLYNASDVMKLIECRTDDNGFETCLIQSSHGRLQLINPKRNQIVWSTRILIGSILPSIIIGISDCDGDDGRDILLSYDRFNTTCIPLTNKTVCTHPGIVQLISGRTGYPLGNRLDIPQSHLIKRVSVHSTRQAENLMFVLTVGNKGHLKVISIQDLYRKILDIRGAESRSLFKNSTVSVSDAVSIDHEPVVKDLNKDFVEDIILVTLSGNKHSLTAVDGGKLKKMWRIAFGAKKMLSQPVIGHFNDDEVPDILVVLQDPMLSMLNQSLVQILDGQNGNIMWSKKLRLAKNTTPLSANVGYKNDVFLLWIEKESKRKYPKIFPPTKVKDVEKQRTKTAQEIKQKPEAVQALTGNFARKNMSDNSTQQRISKHHRSPRNVESHKKMTSSDNDVEAELDSLVDKIFVKDVKPTFTRNSREKRVKPHRKRIENTHKILEDILKQEEEPLTGKESNSHAGKTKTTTSTGLLTQQSELHNSPRKVGESAGPRFSHFLKGNKITKHTVPTTPKPSAKLSHRKRVDEFIINSPGGGNDDGSAGSLTTPIIMNRNIKEVKQKPTTILSTEQSLDKHNEIHDERKGQATTDNAGGNEKNKILHATPFEAKADREAAIEDKDNRRQSPTGTFTPELYGNSQVRPTTKMMNGRKVEDIVIQGNNHGNRAHPTLTSPATHSGSQPGTMQTIKSLPTTKVVSRGIAEDVKVQNHVRDSSNIARDIFTTTKHISSKVTLPMKSELNRKTISEDIKTDNTKLSEKSLVSNIDSIPGRVLAPNPGFILQATKSTKTTRPLSDTMSVLRRDHHIPVTIEGMTDMKTEDTEDKHRAGKDIIVMPTISSVTRLPSGTNLQKSTQEKRQVGYRTTLHQQDTNIDTKVLEVNKPTHARPNNIEHFGHANRQLDSKNTDIFRKVMTTTSASPSKNVHESNQSLSNAKPSTKPQQSSDTKHTKIPMKMPKKKSSTFATLGKSNLETKFKLREGVLLKQEKGAEEVNVDEHGTKNSHISHPAKLNVTGNLDENKAVKEKNPKSNQSETHHALNTTKSHPLKLGNTHHPTARSHVASARKNHHVQCHQGSDLALIAIFPDSQRNTFTVISQESSIRNTEKGFSKVSSCGILWPTLSSNPLVHDADSDGFLEIIYAVNYGEDKQNDRTMRVRKLSIKVDSDD